MFDEKEAVTVVTGKPLVVFVMADDELEIRLTFHSQKDVIKAAHDLKARYYVAVESFDEEQNLPVWGVFDMATAQKNNPTPGEWSINDPIKTFVAEKPDAAVMWVRMRRDKR